MRQLSNKITCIILSFLFCTCSLFKSIDDESWTKYQLARDYVIKDSVAAAFLGNNGSANVKYFPLGVIVSDKIFPPEVAYASQSLRQKINLDLDGRHFSYDDPELLMKLCELDTEYEKKFKDESLGELRSLTTDENAKAIIYFSKVQSNFVCVSLYKDYDRNREGIDWTTSFGSSLDYLFIFENGRIKYVLYEYFAHN